MNLVFHAVYRGRAMFDVIEHGRVLFTGRADQCERFVEVTREKRRAAAERCQP